jgi:hypothetical protein
MAFEPVDLAYRVLNENVYLNASIEKVVLRIAGVSNYNGMVCCTAIKDIGGLGVSMVDGAPAYHKAVNDTAIPVVTLDHYCDSFRRGADLHQD